MYGIEGQVASFGPVIVSTYILTNFLTIIAACCVWFGMDNTDNAVWAGFVTLFVFYGTGITITYFLLKSHCCTNDKNLNDAIYELSFKNVMDLRAELSKSVGWLPTLWAVMMKQMIPHVLLILFINLARSENKVGESQFGNYGDYVAWPYQCIGIACVLVAAVFFLVGLIAPQAFEGADLTTMNTATEGKNIEDDDSHDVSETSQGHAVMEEVTA